MFSFQNIFCIGTKILLGLINLRYEVDVFKIIKFYQKIDLNILPVGVFYRVTDKK